MSICDFQPNNAKHPFWFIYNGTEAKRQTGQDKRKQARWMDQHHLRSNNLPRYLSIYLFTLRGPFDDLERADDKEKRRGGDPRSVVRRTKE